MDGCVWGGGGGRRGYVCESSLNPQTRNRFSSLFADPAHWRGMDFGLYAEPDQHDPSWAAGVQTSLPFHLCLPHGPLLPDPGRSGFHRLDHLSQAFIFPERQGIAGAAEICWLEWGKKNLSREHFPLQWCPRSPFLAHQGQFWPVWSFSGFAEVFPWKVFTTFCLKNFLIDTVSFVSLSQTFSSLFFLCALCSCRS